jgi:helix-turn-helix protein
MSFPPARAAHTATNSLHSMIYFVPETEQRLTGAGLKPGRMCYFAGRSAAMGAVGSGVVTATFYNFHPGLVAHCIPAAWELARPDAVLAARLAAADEALRRLLGPEVIGSAEVARLAGLTREATEACRPEGRPLYAAHAGLAWPDEPHLVLWQALTLLREHRGDGHVWALGLGGLSGIEALVTHTATGRGFAPEFARRSRGYQPEEWDGAVAGLVSRGLMAGDGTLTEAGRALRAQVEDETDRLAAPPWQHLGEERTAEVVQIGQELTRIVVAAEVFPATVIMVP